MPMDEITGDNDKLNNLKDKVVLAVCDAGITSTRAVHELKKLGIESVYGIKGGMNAWTQAGLPVVSAKKMKKKG